MVRTDVVALRRLASFSLFVEFSLFRITSPFSNPTAVKA